MKSPRFGIRHSFTTQMLVKRSQTQIRAILLSPAMLVRLMAALCLGPLPASAFAANAPIAWTTANISAATDVITSGTLDMAFYTGTSGSQTVNMVPSTADNQ